MPLLETRGAASAKGFGFGASSAGVDWSKYMVVPYSNGTTQQNPTRIAMYNVATGTVDFDIPYTPVTSPNDGCLILRIRDWLYYWNVSAGVNAVRGINIITGVAIANQDLSSALDNGDIVKLGNNGSIANPSKIAVCGKSGTDLYVGYWNHNNTTGLFSNTAGTGVGGIFGSSSPTGSSFSSPQAAPLGTIDEFGNYTYAGVIAFCGVSSYPAPSTDTAFGVVTAPYSGSGIGFLSRQNTSDNFSRPKAAMYPTTTGARAYVATFDGSTAFEYVTNGSYSSTGTINTGNIQSNGWGPCGVVNSNYGSRALQANIGFSGPNTLRNAYVLTGGSSSLVDSVIIDPYTRLPTIQQTGYNSTNGALLMETWQLSGTNYAQIARLDSGGLFTYISSNVAYFSNKTINGWTRTSRVVTYGE